MAMSKIFKGATKVAKKSQKKKSTTADKALSKSIGKDAADLTQPADISALGKEYKGNNPGQLSDMQKAGGKRAGVQAAVNKDKKEISELEKKIKALQKQNKEVEQANKGLNTLKNPKKRISGIQYNQNLKKENNEEINSLQEQISLINKRIDDPKTGMVARVPGVKRSYGGKIGTKKTVKRAVSGAIGCGKAMRGLGKGPYKKKGM
jgi:ABC-type phosphate transport system auxiliary subunit